MTPAEIRQAFTAMEARLAAIERRLHELDDRHHELADVLNTISLRSDQLWAEWKAKRREQ